MSDIYTRFMIVVLVSSPLAWLILKYLVWKHHTEVDLSPLTLWACVIAASATCGFVGILLVDGSQYAGASVFFWGIPILFGTTFGVVACLQLFESCGDY